LMLSFSKPLAVTGCHHSHCMWWHAMPSRPWL
jgi:hypothetical protein